MVDRYSSRLRWRKSDGLAGGWDTVRDGRNKYYFGVVLVLVPSTYLVGIVRLYTHFDWLTCEDSIPRYITRTRIYLISTGTIDTTN